MIETVDSLLNYFGQLEKFKEPWLPAWQEVNDYIFPNSMDILGEGMKGDQRSRDTIYISTPITYTNQLAAKITAWLTNPATKWFMFTTNNVEVNRIRSVKEYFSKVRDIVLRELENSNFYTEINKLNKDMIGYGTAVMLSERSHEPGQELYFSTRNIKEVYLAQDAQGVIDTVFRKVLMSVKEIVDEFGVEKLSDEMKKSYEEKPMDEFEILHCVFPRTERKPGKQDPENKEFASIWIDLKNKKILRKSGYTTFPFITPRWSETTGEIYGRGPVLDNMGDIKTLNEMWKTLLITGAKMADPPLMVPDQGFGDIRQGPGELIYYESFTGARVEPLLVGGQLPITFDMVRDKLDSLADAFYITQFQLMDNSPGEKMTAAEVMSRNNEKLVTLGPTVGVLQYEVLSNFVKRVLDLLSPILPEKPQELNDEKIELRFTSPLAKSQRMHEVTSITNTVQSAVMFAQYTQDPAVLDNIDFDKSLAIISDINGTPLEVMRPQDEVDSIRQNRQAQAEQQRSLDQTQQAASILKEGGKGARDVGKLQRGE